MSEELIAVSRGTREHFVHVFRREPGPFDRFDPYTYVISEDDFTEKTVEAMQEVGTDRALIYAFKKTGRVILSTTKDLVPDSALEEWRDAINEYTDALAAGEDLLEEYTAPELAALEAEAARIPFMFGKIIADVSGPIDDLPDSIELFQHTFALYAVTRGAKSLRSINHLLDEHLNEAALDLCRAIYESYLTIVYLLAAPHEWFDLVNAKLGIEIGSHEFGRTKGGKPNRRVIVDVATGRQVRAEISTYEMARTSPHLSDAELHGHLYSLLSSYTHPHPRALGHYLGATAEFTAHARVGGVQAKVLAALCSGLLLDAAIQLHAFGKPCGTDVSTFLHHLRTALQSLHQGERASRSGLSNAILERTRILGDPWPNRLPEGAA